MSKTYLKSDHFHGGGSISSEQAQVDLADSSELFSRFRRGNMLQVSSANQVFSFSLNGTSALLPALLTWVQQETTPVGTNPYRTSPLSGTAARAADDWIPGYHLRFTLGEPGKVISLGPEPAIPLFRGTRFETRWNLAAARELGGHA
jgi:hypothetical protein